MLKDSFRRGRSRTALVAFLRLGAYRLHVRPTAGGRPLPFNCAICIRDEVQRERIELHPGEDLYTGGIHDEKAVPLLRFDGSRLLLWLAESETWWPLRPGFAPFLDFDANGEVVVRVLRPRTR